MNTDGPRSNATDSRLMPAATPPRTRSRTRSRIQQRSFAITQQPQSNDESRDEVLRIDDFIHTHEFVGLCFSDGRTLAELISRLDQGSIDPGAALFLKLAAQQFSGPQVLAASAVLSTMVGGLQSGHWRAELGTAAWYASRSPS